MHPNDPLSVREPTAERSKKWLWVAVAGVAVCVAIALTVLLVIMNDGTGGESSGKADVANSASDQGTSGKPDIATVTEGMLVDRSSFPQVDGATWYSGFQIRAEPPPETEPPICAQLIGSAPAGTDFAYGGLDSKGGQLEAAIQQAGEQVDFKQVRTRCDEYSDPATKETIRTRQSSIPDVPPWALATEYINDDGDVIWMQVIGIYRGVQIRVVCTPIPGEPADASLFDTLGKIFSDQVTKLEAV